MGMGRSSPENRSATQLAAERTGAAASAAGARTSTAVPQRHEVNPATRMRAPIRAPLDLVVRGVDDDTGFRYTRDLAVSSALSRPPAFNRRRPALLRVDRGTDPY